MINWLKNLFRERQKLGGLRRSPQWKKFVEDYEKVEPKVCAATGRKDDVELHHIFPVHVHPERELDRDNVIWLHRDAHFMLGHLGDWKSYNREIVRDANN